MLNDSQHNRNDTWNYGHFLLRESNDRAAVRELLSTGIAANPNSGRLVALKAELDLDDRRADEALEGFRRARDLGAEQASTEAGYACALQLSRRHALIMLSACQLLNVDRRVID